MHMTPTSMANGVRLWLMCTGLLLSFWLFQGTANSEPTTRVGSDSGPDVMRNILDGVEVVGFDPGRACLFNRLMTHFTLLHENKTNIENGPINFFRTKYLIEGLHLISTQTGGTTAIGTGEFEGMIYDYMVIPLQYLPIQDIDKKSFFLAMGIDFSYLSSRVINISCDRIGINLSYEEHNLKTLVLWINR